MIVLGDDMRDRILAKGVAPDRVVVVRDGTSLPARCRTRTHPVVQELRCGFPFVATARRQSWVLRRVEHAC